MSFGETRSEHAGVVAAVATLLRSRADYDLETMPVDESTRAVTDATIIVDAIATWMTP